MLLAYLLIFLLKGQLILQFLTSLRETLSLKVSMAELINMCSIATSQTHFLFNGKVYDQIDGVAMGSPLAPFLANLFLEHLENIWLKNCKGPSVPFY